MLAQIRSCALVGIDALPVDVEVLTMSAERDNFQIVGLVDGAIREARGRVISALQRCGYSVPKVIFVNLAPAEIKKEGAAFDLPIAVGIVIATQQIRASNRRDIFFFGELSLDGTIKSVRGVVALAISAYESGAKVIVVPEKNVSEARLVKGLKIIGARTLGDALRIAEGDHEQIPEVLQESDSHSPTTVPVRPLSQVRGQAAAKRAMVIAAAGGHNLIFVGPPGCGKSMLAERFVNLLPSLTEEERFETVKIHSIVGLPIYSLLDGIPPFRSPHHVVSDVGLIGGGASPRPGEISLAHNGVLFLDEFPEYRRSALESLRTPLETGQVRISRAKGSLLLPARFQLLAAMNPCPCGRLGSKQQRCICSESMLQMYMRRLSQPILERIDLQVELEEVPLSALTAISEEERGEHSARSDTDLSQVILQSRIMQRERQGILNSRLEGNRLLNHNLINRSATALLEQTAKRNLISARSFIRVLRMARTIADLDGEALVGERHIAESMSYRILDRRRTKNENISGVSA